ncbi:MAG TPA: exopolyphosphatase, partial [Terriglobales bacterium]
KVVIATSGTAESLAAVGHNLYKTPNGRENAVSRAQMRRIAKRLSRLPVEERRKLPGIGPRRAEIIVAGAMVYADLLERCQLRGFRFSPLGLRDGMLVQMAADLDKGSKSVKQIESERWESVLAALGHYHVDTKHAMRVRDSAIQLFSALKPVHRLPVEYLEWLSAAAMLNEVGDYVNRNGRHRHTYYIISHSEILGYTPVQRRIIASVARYLGKSRPVPSDPAVKLLSPADRSHVTKASMLLRLATALNLSRSTASSTTRIRVRDGKVNITLSSTRKISFDLEFWAVGKEKDYFREVFGRELSTELA